jgi:hypothetical protein
MEVTEYITECVKHNHPVSFSKYGDGEANCMSRCGYFNCDNDSNTEKLSNGLLNSFRYMTEVAENSFIGQWHCQMEIYKLLENTVSKPVRWTKYHTVLFDKYNDDKKASLYKTIKESKLKKIIVCNPLLIKTKLLLNIDEVILIPFNNWFDIHFDEVLDKVKKIIGIDRNHIVITCCGMSAKVLIAELHKSFPNGIYIDVGSALDTICTKRDSRGHNFGYEYFKEILKDCLPEDWEDDKYNYIYEEAKSRLGLHLH